MKRLLIFLKQVAVASFILCLSSIMSAQEGQSRKCHLEGVIPASPKVTGDGKTVQQASALKVKCDGYANPGRLEDDAEIGRVTLEILPLPNGKSPDKQTVTVELPPTQSREIAKYLLGESKTFREKVKAALATHSPPIRDGGSFNILSLEVGRSAVIHKDDNLSSCQSKLKKLPSAKRLFPDEKLKDLSQMKADELIRILSDYKEHLREKGYSSKENLENLKEVLRDCQEGLTLFKDDIEQLKSLESEVFKERKRWVPAKRKPVHKKEKAGR